LEFALVNCQLWFGLITSRIFFKNKNKLLVSKISRKFAKKSDELERFTIFFFNWKNSKTYQKFDKIYFKKTGSIGHDSD
jgi:hypothetical protein